MNPRDILSLRELFVSAGIVAACVLPVYILLLAVSFLSPGKLIHRWHKPPGPPRTAYLMLCLFLVLMVLFQLLHAGIVQLLSRGLGQRLGINPDPNYLHFAAIIVAAPFMATIILSIRFAATEVWFPIQPTVVNTCRAIVRGIHTWALFLPLTFLVYLIVREYMIAMNYVMDLHPLAKLRPENDGYNGWLFGIAACVFTPWFEEMLFRGAIVPWIGKQERVSKVIPWLEWSALSIILKHFGTWIIMAIAWGFSLVMEKPQNAVLFMSFLTLFLIFILQFGPKLFSRFPTRTVGAIYSSAALFAIVHASVWPTPIPLFVLGLGLGYIVARTGQILPAVVVHGLFNAVSFVMVLRSTPPV